MVERIELQFGRARPGARRGRGHDRVRLLVMGAFGAPPGDTPSFGTLPAGADDLAESLARLAPTVPVDGDLLRPTSLDHFHPDHWIEALPGPRRLLALYRRLGDPAARADALGELEAGGLAAAVPPSGSLSEQAAERNEASPPGAPAETDEQLFGRLLGGTAPGERDDVRRGPGGGRGQGVASGAAHPARETVRRLIQGALGGGGGGTARRLGGGAAADSEAARAARERLVAELARRCRAVLVEPRFRELERAWRSLDWLASRIDEEAVELRLLDLSRDALALHVDAFRARLDASPLHALLNGAERRWDLVVTDYSFGLGAEDLLLLATLGAVSPAPVIAHADLALAGCSGAAAVDRPWDWALPEDELGAMWTAFRRHPAAERVVLATPRFVLRHPYGARSEPLASFPFEELAKPPEHESFLWASPAFACASVAVADGGRNGEGAAGGAGVVEGLPVPIVGDGADRETRPPVEYLLGERAAAAAAQHGLVVCRGGRNSDRMAVAPLRTLSGRDVPFA